MNGVFHILLIVPFSLMTQMVYQPLQGFKGLIHYQSYK